jgi:hypothetical protein
VVVARVRFWEWELVVFGKRMWLEEVGVHVRTVDSPWPNHSLQFDTLCGWFWAFTVSLNSRPCLYRTRMGLGGIGHQDGLSLTLADNEPRASSSRRIRNQAATKASLYKRMPMLRLVFPPA